jgi:hypothetical protein
MSGFNFIKSRKGMRCPIIVYTFFLTSYRNETYVTKAFSNPSSWLLLNAVNGNLDSTPGQYGIEWKDSQKVYFN